MIRPTLRLVLIATAGIPLAVVVGVVDPRLFPIAAGLFIAILLVACLDGLTLPRPSAVLTSFTSPDTLYIADRDPLMVRIETPTTRTETSIEVLSELSELLLPEEPVRVVVPARGAGTAALPLVPLRRGSAEVRAVWFRYDGRLGLVRRVVRRPVGAEIGVIPNVRAVREAAIRFFRSREFVVGLKTERYLGDGSEFDSLREYLPGLDSRVIDWKASARHVKLVAREYRAERDHQIVAALDTGHLMREPVDGVPKLDHGINASLLLAYTALKTGDRIGLFAFDSRVRMFAEPRGGMVAFPRIQRLTTGLDYSTAETNFTLGLLTLGSRLTRRTLVVVFTDFTDTTGAELMVENLGRLADRHLVLCVTLSDPDLARIATGRPRSLLDLNRAVVAGDLVREREVVLKRLKRRGVHCVDAPARAVSAKLINRYLDIRRRELV